MSAFREQTEEEGTKEPHRQSPSTPSQRGEGKFLSHQFVVESLLPSPPHRVKLLGGE